MSTRIDSLDIISCLCKGDVVFQPTKQENYRIIEVCADCFIVMAQSDRHGVRMIRFPVLREDNWWAEKDLVFLIHE
ncbi:MAG TPA: hypothetical protein VKR32_06830 [Puia sp.]|nr:hypothetical protein [Puia sp.]